MFLLLYAKFMDVLEGQKLTLPTYLVDQINIITAIREACE